MSSFYHCLLDVVQYFNTQTLAQQGKRGGQTFRQRTQIRETTPDASGNVFARADKDQQRIHNLISRAKTLQRTAGRQLDRR